MIYKLLDTNTGVILTRQQHVVKGEAKIEVKGAPDGANIIFITENREFVRKLECGFCVAPVAKMNGTVSVCVKALNERGRVRTWNCEGIVVTQLGEGNVLLVPDDMDMPAKFVQLLAENQEMRENMHKLENTIKELSQKVDGMLEGWDIV